MNICFLPPRLLALLVALILKMLELVAAAEANKVEFEAEVMGFCVVVVVVAVEKII